MQLGINDKSIITMPVYDYTALDLKGKTITGIIDAESALSARQRLRTSNFFPVDIKEVAVSASKKKKTKSFTIPNPFSRVRPSEITMMTRQLATLVDAGLPLVSAIYSLIPQTKSQALKKILSHIKDSIEEGSSLEGAMSRYSETFSPIFVNMVRAGESSGTLEIVLGRLADISEKQQALRHKVRAALAYPVFMSIFGSIVLLVLLTYIVPTITTIFSDIDQVLPAPTRFLIATSDFLKAYWWIILILLIGAIFGIRRITTTTKGRYFIDKMILRLPVFGSLAQKLAVARFARTLGSLLENGVAMLSALKIVENIVGNAIISKTIDDAAIKVEKGIDLGTALSDSQVFPDLAVQMIQVGEHSGELEPMLHKTADVYENEIEASIASLTSLLDPVLILVMGVVVGFIVLAICLPIFEMNQLIK